jgi:hypothetical protein
MAYASAVPIERRSVARQRLPSQLPEDGSAGRTVYLTPRSGATASTLADDDSGRLDETARASDTGAVLFERTDTAILVVPPFPVEHAATFDEIRVAPLLDLLERRRSYAVLLLRLGGFAVGFFRGDGLVDSKVGQRFVKNRHRKGGQSSTRFARIREKQVDELFEKVCEASQDKLAPYETEVEHVFFGGDRRTLMAFRKECRYFDRFEERLRSRVLPAHGDPRLAMLQAIPRQVFSSDIYEAKAAGPAPGL